MQASIAIQGDGAFEGDKNYMDSLAEMQDKAEERLTDVQTSWRRHYAGKPQMNAATATIDAKEAEQIENHIMEAYATDLDSFLSNKP